MVQVKICGVRTAEAMDAVAEAGADWVGFVFFPASPRAVTGAEAAPLAGRHPGGPRAVGLFVEPTDEELRAVLDLVPLAALQVHAGAGRAAAIRERFGVPVWLALGVSGSGDLPGAAVPGVDALLLDHKAPPGATRPGGNATRFDWSVLEGWRAPLPWMLAGGLTPGNVAEAVRTVRPPGVDVSSGVERVRGEKDPALIREFVRAARAG